MDEDLQVIAKMVGTPSLFPTIVDGAIYQLKPGKWQTCEWCAFLGTSTCLTRDVDRRLLECHGISRGARAPSIWVKIYPSPIA